MEPRNDGSHRQLREGLSASTMGGNQHESEHGRISWGLLLRTYWISPQEALCQCQSALILCRVRADVPCLSIAEPYFSNQQLASQQAPRTKLESIGFKPSSR